MNDPPRDVCVVCCLIFFRNNMCYPQLRRLCSYVLRWGRAQICTTEGGQFRAEWMLLYKLIQNNRQSRPHSALCSDFLLAANFLIFPTFDLQNSFFQTQDHCLCWSTNFEVAWPGED